MNSKTRDEKTKKSDQSSDASCDIASMNSSTNKNACCKIGKKSQEYGFMELYKELPDLWLGKGTEERSLRELQERINVEILRSALEKEGVDTVVGEVEAMYEVLTEDSYTAGEKTEVTSRLESEGVDIKKVKEDFISHQSVANHLNGCLEVTKGGKRGSVENDARNVRSLKNMAKDRLEQIVEKHRKRGNAEFSGDYRVEADFYVVDEDGKKTTLDEMIGREV